MATHRSGHRPGGGLHSRVVKHSSNPQSEPKAYARNPAAVAQYGELVGNHRTTFGGSETRYKGEPDTMRKGYRPPVGPTSFSNTGVGGGRTIYKSGSQCQTGAANPGNAPAKSTDILRQFGPDSRK